MNPLTFFGAFLLSIPAVIDWSTQTLELRESRNFIRAISGFLLGYAVGLVLASNDVIYWILVAVLYSGYTIIFGTLAFIRRILVLRASLSWLEGPRYNV